MMQGYPKMDLTLQKKETKMKRKGTKTSKKGSTAQHTQHHTAKSGSTKHLEKVDEQQAVVAAVGEHINTLL